MEYEDEVKETNYIKKQNDFIPKNNDFVFTRKKTIYSDKKNIGICNVHIDTENCNPTNSPKPAKKTP